MRLERLTALRLPGIGGGGFELEDLSPGVNVIVGPNGSGKTSLCRAVRALLWEDEPFRGEVRSEWAVGEGRVALERETGTAPRLRDLGSGTSLPDLPEARFRRCFTLSVDDFLTDSGTDEEIALEIRKELAAGFDLSAVLASERGRGARSGGALQKASALQRARRDKEALAATHRRLAGEARDQGALREELEQAKAAARATSGLRDALELAKARLAAREAAARLEAFPAGIERLHGDEAVRLEELAAAIEQSERDVKGAREQAEAAKEVLARCGLGGPVPAEDLETLSTREQRLRALEQTLARAREGEAAAAAHLEEASRSLRRFSAHALPAELHETGWRAVEDALRELSDRRARVAALRAEIEDAGTPEEDRAEPPYHDGIRALARWLEGGAAAGRQARLGLRFALCAGAVLVLAGFLSYAIGGGLGWLLVLLGLALLGWGGWVLRRGAEEGDRAQWEREYAGLGLDPPEPWSVDEVTNRLARLLRESAAFEERRQHRASAEQKRAQLARAEEAHAAAEAALAECLGERGLPLTLARLELTEVAELLLQRTHAAGELAETQARRLETGAACGRELDHAGELFARHGGTRPADAADLQRRRESLARREQERATAAERLEHARSSEARANEVLASWRGKRGELFRRLALEGDDEDDEDVEKLRRLLEALPEWRDAREAQGRAELEVSTHASRLADRAELLELSVEEAARLLEESEALAARQEELAERIARVEAEVRRASAGHELEDALAAEQRALEALEETRRELFESAAADFLVETIAREHADLAEPDILRRAAERFGRFTSHRYRLTSPRDALEAGPGFAVRESDGGEKQIAELSSGTLSQLCLALRLAVAESVERDEPLPVFLDEALTNSDPVRFREVVLSLAELAREGRQLFFLTADPDDARRLEEILGEPGGDAVPCRRYDLALLRGEKGAAESLEHTPLPEVPAPRPAEDAASYGERLLVPAIDPFAGVDALHTFYLLSDDLAALHAILAERVETVGQVALLLESHPRPVWDEAQRARFTARRTVAAAWLEAYRIGRSPRVLPEVLREGPAGRTKYFDALAEICEEVEGDAARLLAALEPKERDARLKGFRNATVDLLREDLEARGLFTESEPLDEEALEGRALAAALPHLEEGAIDREEVCQLAAAFADWLPGEPLGQDAEEE